MTKFITLAEAVKREFNIKEKKPKKFDKELLVIKTGLVIATLLLIIPAFIYWNKAQIRKDCIIAIQNYNKYGVIPEQNLVKSCHKLGI